MVANYSSTFQSYFSAFAKFRVACGHGVDELRNVIDTQLAAEMISGEPRLGFNDVLEVFGRQPHPAKQAAKKRMKTDASMWLRRATAPALYRPTRFDRV